MSQPNYKLKDDHVACVGHLRSERTRNDSTYEKPTDLVRVHRLIGNTTAIDAVEWNANGNNAVIKKYGVRENGTLAYDQVPAWENVTQLAATKANSSDIYNRAETDNKLALKANQATTYTKTETDTALALKANQATTYTKTETDTALALKANQATTYTKTETDTALALKANQATTYTKTETDTALAAKLNLSGGTMTGNLNMGGHRLIQSYNPQVNHDVVNKETLDVGLSGKKNTGTFDVKIQTASTNAALDCSGDNRIDIKVNGANRGFMYQPTGQATTPLGIVSTDKLQLQSELSSTSVYGSKTLSSDGSLNTHGLYVGGIDDALKNVQSTVNVQQGNAQVYLTAGHVNPGSGMADFCVLAANGTLQVSGGLLPGISDKQILLYSGAKGQALPIQADGKMGYTAAANVAITEATQFPTKAYVDTQRDTRLALSGGTLTGALTLSGAPTTNLMAATKAYVDAQFAGAGTGDFKANGTVAMTGALNMGTTNKIINLAEPTLAQDGATKSYVDNKTSALSNGALKLVDNNQADGNKYELKIDNNQLEFRRGANTDDLYLKLYGSTTESSDGVVQESNRNNWFYESTDSTGLINRIWLNHTVDNTAGSTYLKSAPLRITQGTTGTQPYAQVSALNTEVGGSTNSLTMYPKNSMTSAIANKTQSSLRMGYASGVTLDTADSNSILSKGESDAAYLPLAGGVLTGSLTLSGAPTTNLMAATKAYVDAQVAGAGTGDFKANGTVAMTGNLQMGGNKITNIVNGVVSSDVMTKGYIDGADAALQGQITNLDASQLTKTAAETTYLNKATTDDQAINSNVTVLTSKVISQPFAATLGSHLTNKTYVDGAVGTCVAKSGATMTGLLTLFQDPITDYGAATKKYVDDVAFALTNGNQQIQTNGGYAMVTSSTNIKTKYSGSDIKTFSSDANSVTDTLASGYTRRDFKLTGNLSTDYTPARFLVAGDSNGRPIFKITDKGGAYQTYRLSTFQNNAGSEGSEVYIQMQPTLGLIYSNAPIGLINPNITFQNDQLVTKKYVDDSVVAAGGAVGQLQNGTYRLLLGNAGSLSFYDNSSTRALNFDIASSIEATLNGGSGTGRQLVLASSSGTDPSLVSKITLRRPFDQSALPIVVSDKMGYAVTTTIDQANQFTSKAYVDSVAGTSGFYTKAEIQRYCAFKERVPDWTLGNLGLKTRITELDPPNQDLSVNFYKLVNCLPGTSQYDAVNYKQMRENRTWVARITLGDPASGTPSIIASTNSFVTSVTKPSSDGVSATYTVNFASGNCPDFINSGTYLPTASVIAPLSTEGSTTFTWLNDSSPIICGNLSSSSMQFFWEQTNSTTQINNIVLSIVNLNIA